MIDITPKLKERFCKDCNIPLKIYEEPYFTDRLVLYDLFYQSIHKWNIFKSELKEYHCEQDYFEEYNRIKDQAINDIKNTDAYQRYNQEDMHRYSLKYVGLPSKDIFKPSNDEKLFISIDMKKANFSALRYYDKNIFRGVQTWEQFIGFYTNNHHIINSKYIRQVILGNCNPKRHITYEKYLMDQVLDCLIREVGFWVNEVVFFSNDEIVIDMENYADCIKNRNIIQKTLEEHFEFPLKIELFYLHKVNGTQGYCKEIVENLVDSSFQFKCLDGYMLPFVMRYMLNEDVTENDKVFIHEGKLAKFIETPEIEVNLSGAYRN